jgi:hypothetical protein
MGLVVVPQDQQCPSGTYNQGGPINGFNGCFPNGINPQEFSGKLIPYIQNIKNSCQPQPSPQYASDKNISNYTPAPYDRWD